MAAFNLRTVCAPASLLLLARALAIVLANEANQEDDDHQRRQLLAGRRQFASERPEYLIGTNQHLDNQIEPNNQLQRDGQLLEQLLELDQLDLGQLDQTPVAGPTPTRSQHQNNPHHKHHKHNHHHHFRHPIHNSNNNNNNNYNQHNINNHHHFRHLIHNKHNIDINNNKNNYHHHHHNNHHQRRSQYSTENLMVSPQELSPTYSMPSRTNQQHDEIVLLADAPDQLSTPTNELQYSNIVRAPQNAIGPFGVGARYWQDSHLASIKIEQEPSEHEKGSLNSAIIAILFGFGVTGMLIMVVTHKMRSIRRHVTWKDRRRSLVPDTDILIQTIPI